MTPLKDRAAGYEYETFAEFMKANEAALFLNVSRRTFERMKDAGQIPHIRCGGGRVLRYRKADLIAAMSALTVR
jgi:excisionase family DNA binding protein